MVDRRTDPRTLPPIAVRGSEVQDPRLPLLSRPALGAYLALTLAAVLQVVPGLQRWRLFERLPVESPAPAAMAPAAGPEVGEARIESETRARPELAQPEEVKLPRATRGPIATQRPGAGGPRIDIEEPPVSIVDPEHRGLAGFYRALHRTERKQEGSITRILHFGDSIIVSDYISATLRRRFQRRFGDAGHGFMLIANPWPAYFHNDVYRFASSGWLVKRIVGPLASDGIYGLGCVSFRAPPGARARFGTARKGKYGRAVSRFELVYYQQPDGGKLRINLDGKPHSLVDTQNAEKRVATSVIRVPDGEHLLEVVTVEGYSRLFGMVMERDTPGVVLDAIGIQGARARFLDKQEDEHWRQQLAWRKPALLIYQFGANESGDGFAYPMEEYLQTLVEVLRQGKQAVPDAGCLVIGAMDRASRRGTQLRSMAVIPHLVEQQRQAAAQAGCAFWNTYEAMGGLGSMATWVQRGLGQADLTHPTGTGCEVLGKWIYRALMQGYLAYHRDSG